MRRVRIELIAVVCAGDPVLDRTSRHTTTNWSEAQGMLGILPNCSATLISSSLGFRILEARKRSESEQAAKCFFQSVFCICWHGIWNATSEGLGAWRQRWRGFPFPQSFS